MLLFLFITLAIGLILFFDGYKKEMKKGKRERTNLRVDHT